MTTARPPTCWHAARSPSTPFDARGVVSSPVHAASSPQKNYARNPHAFARDEARFEQVIFSEHSTMSQMAEDTGGRAFMDTDGLTAAVAQGHRERLQLLHPQLRPQQ